MGSETKLENGFLTLRKTQLGGQDFCELMDLEASRTSAGEIELR